jgi:hypothetical protein
MFSAASDIGSAGAHQSAQVAAGAAPVDAATAAAQANAQGLSAFECRSCGAAIVVATATRASTTCVYCHSPVVLTGQLAKGLEPDTVVPFTISHDQALAIFHDWITKKRYLAKGFYSRDRVDQLQGIYFPYFAVDAELDTNVEGTAHYETGSGDNRQDHYFHVIRQGQVQIENLPQEALRFSRADKMINRLLPWDLTKQTQFAPQYLVGFQTERRDLDFGEVQHEAAKDLDLAARRLMATDVLQRDSRFSDVRLWGASRIRRWRHRYTLLPAWVLFYIAPGGGLYYFGINGQTGEAAGRVPLNKRKLLAHTLLIASLGVLVILAGLALEFL